MAIRYPKIGDFILWDDQSWFVFDLPIRAINYGGIHEQEMSYVLAINANNEIAHFSPNPLRRVYMAAPDNPTIPTATFDAPPFNLEQFLTHEDPQIREIVKLLERK